MRKARGPRVVDYLIALLPVWLALNAFELGYVVALTRAARGVSRVLVFVVQILFPPFFPRTSAGGLLPTVALFVHATTYLALLLLQSHRSWWRTLVMGTLVWFGLTSLGFLTDNLAGGLLIWSRGGPFRFHFQPDVFAYLMAYQILALAPAATLVSILHALHKRIRLGRHTMRSQ